MLPPNPAIWRTRLDDTLARLTAYLAELTEQMEGMEKIIFDYSIDEGSMIYLEERIGRIREERQLQPGSLMF